MTEVARRYRFNAVHSLPGFPEPWCRKHGHQYTVEVVARGEGTCVVDTDKIDTVWRMLRPSFAWRDLDDLGITTTVESLASYLLTKFGHVAEVCRVTVWEDDDRWGRVGR